MERLFILVAGVAVSGAAHAVTNGFVEDFSVDTGGFGGNSPLGPSTREIGPAQPGFGGATNGFLNVTAGTGDNLATRAIGGNYQGDYVAAGIDEIAFWLVDTDTLDDAVIRVGIGDRRNNFWLSNRNWDVGADWERFSVDLVASQWTQVIGSDGDFEGALRNADVLQFRASADGTAREPDAIVGSFGVDNIAFIPSPGVGAAALLGLAFASRRRRG